MVAWVCAALCRRAGNLSLFVRCGCGCRSVLPNPTLHDLSFNICNDLTYVLYTLQAVGEGFLHQVPDSQLPRQFRRWRSTAAEEVVAMPPPGGCARGGGQWAGTHGPPRSVSARRVEEDNGTL